MEGISPFADLPRAEQEALAALWGLSGPVDAARLAATSRDREFVARLIGRLGQRERAALELLAQHGSLSAARFEAEFGAIRPHSGFRSPRAYLLALSGEPSPTERLFLLALIERADRHHERHYRMAAWLRDQLPPPERPPPEPRLPPTNLPSAPQLADLRRLEGQIVALLALAHHGALLLGRHGLLRATLLRIAAAWGEPSEHVPLREREWPYVQWLRLMLQQANLLQINASHELRPNPDLLTWLRAPRTQRLSQLLLGWRESTFDELTTLVALTPADSDLERDLRTPRRTVLRALAHAPTDGWFAPNDLVAELRRTAPLLARPDGDFFAWRLSDRHGRPRDGFAHWDEVEGGLIRAYLQPCLHWLGLLDLDRVDEPASAARLTAWGRAVIMGSAPPDEPDQAALIEADGTIFLSPLVSPETRFQIGRIANRLDQGEPHHAATYRLSRASVQAACRRGADAERLLALLERASANAVPQAVSYLVREWAADFGQIALRYEAVLQTGDPLLFEQIRHDQRLNLPPFEPIDPQTWLLAPADASDLLVRLQRAGYGVVSHGEPPSAPLASRDLIILLALAYAEQQHARERGAPALTSSALIGRLERLLSRTETSEARTLAEQLIRQTAPPTPPTID